MNKQLHQLIAAALTEVQNDPVRGLSFKTRREILRELGPIATKRAIIGPGLIRRTQLCRAVVEPALPLWETHYDTKDPHKMIELAGQYLNGTCDRKALLKNADAFRGALDTSDTPDKQVAFLVGRGSVCAAFVAAFDELLEPDEGMDLKELQAPEDPDHWDCAYWIAAASAQGMPWEPAFNREKCGAFWNWYLNVAIPKAWAVIPT